MPRYLNMQYFDLVSDRIAFESDLIHSILVAFILFSNRYTSFGAFHFLFYFFRFIALLIVLSAIMYECVYGN